ncbi:protein-disulfide reductase [Ornithobacterium rhinotracheale]|uniref:protein-disulfide reductase DsbD family protein n=1 Tax=Ornithobacterium rhinotracheale TaxID=28251 RepID=UPI00129C1632|nr:cytochrome c biogenesis protein CcdA [Ornithobacterium rhinotracheale]MRJ08363.1 protein-disulfide reductase [Ornithobacterium rhinotracheale]UOH77557.1 thioredoxin family protein [Ornithobacterium rhinotracheale]
MFEFTKIRLSILFTIICGFALAQMLNPVNWKTEQKTLENGNYQLIFTATMDAGWHIYSIQHPEGGVGIPTSFDWKKNKDYELVGKIKEIGKLHDEFVPAFNEQHKFYGDKVSFVQEVKALKDTKVAVDVTFQACDDSRCIAPDYKEFSFDLKASAAPANATPETTVAENTQTESQPAAIDSALLNENAGAFTVDTLQQDKPEVTPATHKEAQKQEKKKGLFDIFILGLLGGFAALLMPCLFPMIPLTVSMFTKQSKTRGSGIFKAFVYGVSIITIYVGLGLLVTLLYGASTLNEIASHPVLNFAFFVIFIIFAISFFGAFEITLPSKWINKADKNADKGGYIGIFFMALTLVLVSFSCTGPIVGTLLVESARGGQILAPAIGMFGFSFALALPFTLFAIFPSWLNSLPSSGGWLNTIKVCLGFIELAFAMKFLSNADMVLDLHWLEREIFVAAWVAIFFVMGLYLLNIFRMPLDSVTERIGTPRLLFALVSFVIVFYLLPGIWGAPLKIVDGLIPPQTYSESPLGLSRSVSMTSSEASDLPPNAHYGPHQIPSFHDLDDAFAYAKKVNKPVMLDFTGKTCANCRRVEGNVWSNPKVKEKLSNDVVLASLYVDSFEKLPEAEQVFSEEKGRKLKTLGDKWTALQIKEFKSNSQPLYIIIDPDFNRYNEPIGAELDPEKYLNWLEEGIQKFKNK